MSRKKIFTLGVIALLLSCSFIPSVFAGDFTCVAFGDDVLIDDQIADIIHTIILGIQVIIPVLLVIFGMIDLMKAIMSQKEDEIKKGQQTFVKRIIAAVLVFLVIVIVKLVINFVAKDSEGIMACANCFIEGSSSDSCIRDSGGTADPAGG